MDLILGFVSDLKPEVRNQTMETLFKFAMVDGEHSIISAYAIYCDGTEEQRSQILQALNDPRRDHEFREALAERLLRENYAPALSALKKVLEERIDHPYAPFVLLSKIGRYDNQYMYLKMTYVLKRAYHSQLEESSFWHLMGSFETYAEKYLGTLLNMVRTVAQTDRNVAEWTRNTLVSNIAYHQRFHPGYARAVHLLSDPAISSGDQFPEKGRAGQ